jgi:hypothetical protein
MLLYRDKKTQQSQVLVAHACNPSYSGGRSGGSKFKANWGKYLERPYLEKTHHKKRAGGVSG